MPEAAKEALKKIGVPEIMNSDQGSQFTSPTFVETFEKRGAKISWDGRGRVYDNIFIERFWRSLKYEEVYLNQYANGKEALQGIEKYMKFYNMERPHFTLEGKTPHEVFFGGYKLKNKTCSMQACAELSKAARPVHAANKPELEKLTQV